MLKRVKLILASMSKKTVDTASIICYDIFKFIRTIKIKVWPMSPRIQFKFNSEKALEALLYVASKAKTPDRYHIVKIFYFADMYHLEKYGRFICGDNYTSMAYGPTPSNIYDMIKGHYRNSSDPPDKDFVCRGRQVLPTREPDLEKLSKSDIKCLDRAIKENESLSFDVLHAKAHQVKACTVEEIVKTFPNPDQVMEHLSEYYLR